MPSTKMSTLLVMPLTGSLREDLVVYWNSKSTTSPTVRLSDSRVIDGEVPPTKV